MLFVRRQLVLRSERVPNCQKCGQHGRKSRLKGHKRICPFKECTCAKLKKDKLQRDGEMRWKPISRTVEITIEKPVFVLLCKFVHKLELRSKWQKLPLHQQ
ncbi:DM DNA binding domain protein [Necator americanus]|uniref:DM DNA binding domain protein n=1 Tax=Necator americanus TaxID=51031 RepID=W2SHP9_NECAM|nr:DM DNA binding domain protein [Necator americanus]ETN69130.1 DM DNA binding domain protein [Necator americanus]